MAAAKRRWKPGEMQRPANRTAINIAAGLLLAALGGYAIAASGPPHPIDHITGWYWQRIALLTPALDLQVRSVDVESVPSATPSAFAAMGIPGSVYVYGHAKLPNAAQPTWNKEATLSGTYVSLSGTTLAAGLPSPDAGSVQVYQRVRGVWQAMGSPLTPSITSPLGMDFGRPVQLEGAVLIVGSPRFEQQGRAFIFELQGGVWTETAVLGDAPGQAHDESLFGAAIGVSGEFVAVGQTPDDAPGTVYLYQKQAGNWTLNDTLQARDPANPTLPAAAGDLAAGNFGKAIVLSGTQLAVRSDGYLQVFERTLVGGTWQWSFKESYAVASSSSSFNHRPLAFDGTNLLTGEPWSPAVSNPPGRVRLLLGAGSLVPGFHWPFDEPDDYFIVENPAEPDAEFGRAMAVDKAWLMIGDKQHARLYQKVAY